MGKNKKSKSDAEDIMSVDIPEVTLAVEPSEAKPKRTKKRVLGASAAQNEEGDNEEPPRKKKKSRKDKAVVEFDDDADASSSSKKPKERKEKKSKKSKKNENAMEVDAEPSTEASPTEQSAEFEADSGDIKKSKDKKSKKKRNKKFEEEDALDASELSSEPSSPTKDAAPSNSPANAETTLCTSLPKKKREKRPKDRIKSTPLEQPTSSESSTNKKRKKARKNNTSFPDPGSDETLNAQSRKALDYAFTQFNCPSDWKFNKARQNWIVRNVFDVESIPDTYFALASKYLSGLQGGSRTKLKETCSAIINAPPTAPKPLSTHNEPRSILKKPADETSSPAKSKISAKAAPLIDAPKAGALIQPEAPKEFVPPGDRKLERAKSLLGALEALI